MNPRDPYSRRRRRAGGTTLALALALMASGQPCSATGRAEGAEEPAHRAILLDWRKFPAERGGRSDKPDLVLLDMDNGRVLARRRTGLSTELCISADGKRIAVVTNMVVAGQSEQVARLMILSSEDLSIVAQGYLPFGDRYYYMPWSPSWPVLCFSADGKDVAMPHGPRRPSPDRPYGMDMDAYWTAVRWTAGPAGGPLPTFAVNPELKSPLTPKSGGRKTIAGTRRWPQIDVNGHGGVLQTLSLDSGETVQKLVVTDHADSKYNKNRGRCYGTPEGNTAYYVPDAKAPGRVKRIDLNGPLPKISQVSETVFDDLHAYIAAPSETAGALFVGIAPALPRGAAGVRRKPKRIIVISTQDLSVLNVLRAPPFDILAVSHDGTQLYVVHRDNVLISVFDTGTGKFVRSFAGLVRYPTTLIPLP